MSQSDSFGHLESIWNQFLKKKKTGIELFLEARYGSSLMHQILPSFYHFQVYLLGASINEINLNNLTFS